MWFKVLEPGTLSEGDVRSVHCAGRALCVLKANGQFAALDDACPHQGAPLGDGWVEEGLLICPRHAWAFDPFKGSLAGSEVQEITTYPIEERDDGVYVAVPEPRKKP
ncbi:MAG: Rieske 2Fe-2S domain-containing protein [Deltaproteobacteria bacterium]|nr:Rieske 2Fe-2S domain-containing protein [Deltaproteobacteria bacterium]